MPGRKHARSKRVAQGPERHATAPPAAALHDLLLAWYAAHQRDLPWRRTRDPYAIWVSEIMLQQTRVETARPYYERFLARFPTAAALAEAKPDDVLTAWSGLGYYRRARLLHEGARAVVAAGGEIPSEREALKKVPGIGRYTAGAIASIAFGRAVGLVDGNVARVLARLFAIDDDMRKGGLRRAEALADTLVPARDPGAWNQALMELGATVCTPRAPACGTCPVATQCRARAEGRAESLPVLSAKAPPKPARVQVVVATRGGAVLLARRRPGKLFGGLWEPPSAEGALAARRALLARVPARGARLVGRVTHVLSHRKLTVDVLSGALDGALEPALAEPYDAIRVFELDALGGVALSTLARKVLACAGLSVDAPAAQGAS